MSKKNIFFLLAILVLSFKTVLADAIIPLTFVMIPIIPLIILIEALTLWIIIKKVLVKQIGFWKSLLIVFMANITTSLIGTFIPIGKLFHLNIIFILGSLIVSVFIEWLIYLSFLKKSDIKKIELLGISIVGNCMTYSLIFILGIY